MIYGMKLIGIRLVVQVLVALGADRLLRRMFAPRSDAEAMRARYGIHAFVGANGSGKTNLMVRQAARALERGTTVYSNIPIFADRATGELHPKYVALTSFEQLMTIRDGILLLDEMTGIANARDNAPLPGPIQLVLNQLRKRKLVCYHSSPAWEDTTAQIRRVTRAVTFCEGSFPDRRAVAAASSSSDFDEAWVPNRFFRARTFPKDNRADWGLSAAVKLGQPLVEEFYWGPGCRSFQMYDTNAETFVFGSSNDYGTCVVCEGSRRRLECTCNDYQEMKAAQTARRPSRRSAALSAPQEPSGAFHDHDHDHGTQEAAQDAPAPAPEEQPLAV
ncbi:hypothetical protein [Homoserinibacter sp. YIM 151385]|uniref:hypothetical protein n=1 Tax=Homoserinibacter sp. YIM 151385 TaxID=2985506 RepID=UPI0022F12459|nr:hypothetical protein [Homoserinibacter sp. YIM 151385]WBU38525.1 hypothetical protein OF852_02765 [Homoserinibacter sp. YIM 151385]